MLLVKEQGQHYNYSSHLVHCLCSQLVTTEFIASVHFNKATMCNKTKLLQNNNPAFWERLEWKDNLFKALHLRLS